MSRTGKRNLNTLLVIGLVMSLLLTACSKKDSTASSTPTSAAAGANETDSSTKSDVKVYEYNWLSINSPLKDDSLGQKFMEDTFHIKMKIVRVDDEKYQEQLNLLLATGDIPDLMYQLDYSKLTQMKKNDVLAELPESFIQENMPKYYEIVKQADPNAFTYGVVDGKNYVLPLPVQQAKYPYPLAIRGDWLKNVGAEIPKTLEQFEEVFLKFRNNDPDQNGKKDTYAMSMGSDNPNPATWFHPIFGAYGTNPFLWQDRDGKLVYGFTEEGTKEGLKLLQKWYKEGIIDPEFVTDKNRNNNNDDVAYKFAAGKIGYLDNLGFDDHQWDNDGHLNAKWVANHPEWKKFYEESKDPNVAYSVHNFMSIPTSGPQPVYVNVTPPVGSDQQSGAYKQNVFSGNIVFGKQLAADKEKFAKLLQILETLATDETIYSIASWGPEGKQWAFNDKKQRMAIPEFAKSEEYHPQGRILGAGRFINPMYGTNPDFLTLYGGQRMIQRFNYTGDEMALKAQGIEDALKAPLPSSIKYPDLPTMLKEYFFKAILGEVDIDKTFDEIVAKWKANGGDVLTKEANDWLSSLK